MQSRHFIIIYYQFQRDSTFIMPLAYTDMQLVSLHLPECIFHVIAFPPQESTLHALATSSDFKLFSFKMDLLALIPTGN